MTLFTILVVTCAMIVAWRVNPGSRGMRFFSIGLITLTIGASLGLARVVFHGAWVIALCNVFMLGGMMLIARGVRYFREFPGWSTPALVAFWAAAAVPFTYWLLIHDDFGMRVGVMSAAFSLLCLDAARSMFRNVPRPARLTYWPTGSAFLFAAAYLSVRAFGGWSGSYGDSLLTGVPDIEFVSTICANIAYVGCAVGMILSSNTQLWQHAQTMAHVDALTNLPNRRWFLDRLLAAEERAIANRSQLGIIYLDLDGFKAVNDRLGHATGDALLQRVSSAMTGVIRASDCAARLGGDEFVVLAEQVESRAQLATLASRLKEAIEGDPVPGTEEEPVRVSIGMAVFPDDGSSAHDAMREADAAMYLTKRQSRWPQPAL